MTTTDDLQHARTWDDLASVIDLAAPATVPAPAKAGIMTSVTAAGNAAPRTTPPEGRSASVRRQPAAVTPPKARPRLVPLTPMRQATAKSMTKLADDMKASHPEMSAHQHLRDAARTLRTGNEEQAQRHLRAAMFSLSPQSLMRHGLHTDDAHIEARQAMHGVHRHLLLVKDIADVGEKNRAARLLAVGHGGQVLVSGAMHELLANRLSGGVGLRDLSEHRLQDLGRAERVSR